MTRHYGMDWLRIGAFALLMLDLFLDNSRRIITHTLALVVMTDPDQRTLPLWLQGLVEANRATDWGVVMAGAALIAVPVIVFFLLVQSRMTAGLVAGAVKG